MFKLVLEEAEGPGLNCQHLLDHRKSKRVPENTYFCFIDYAKAFDCVDHNKLWETLQEMGIPDLLTCLLGNLYAVRKHQLEPDMEQQTGSKLGKEYVKTVYCHPAYLTYAEYIMWNASLDESITSWNQDCQEKYQQTSDMQMISPLRQKAKRN